MIATHIGVLIHRKGKNEMSVFRNIKSRVQNLKEKIQGHHKWKMFLYAGIFILILVYIWLFYTNTGWLARTSFFKSFNHHPDRIVRIYAGNELIEEYVGEYSIENYQGYLVLIDFKNQERINLYGDVVAVVDTPRNNVDNSNLS